MKLIFWVSASSRIGGACATDMSELDWYNYWYVNCYPDVAITNVIPLSEHDYQRWIAHGKQHLTRQQVKLKGQA